MTAAGTTVALAKATTVEARWFWTGGELLQDAVVGLREGRICEIKAEQALGDRAVDLLLPGLVNAHSHSFQRAFRGVVQAGRPNDDFFTWREAMYATANELSPDGVEAVARLCFMEMAEAGVTAVGEFHYLHHDPVGRPYDDPDELARRVVQAALDVGIRVTLLRCAYARSGFGQPPTQAQRRFIDGSPDDVLAAAQRLSQGADPRVNVGLAPHSVRAVPAEWLPEFASFDGPVHAHVAEQDSEVQACFRAHGCSPLNLFAQAGLVNERFTAVHLTLPSDGDTQTITESGASLCVCPSTELDLGDGFLPLPLRSHPWLCIGSDSHAVIDPLAEARALELHGRGQARRRLVMLQSPQLQALAARILRSASAAGRRSLGRDAGPLTVGSQADLCALDLDRPAADGVGPLVAAAFVARPEWISQLWVAGEPVLDGGRHPRRAAIREAASPYFGKISS